MESKSLQGLSGPHLIGPTRFKERQLQTGLSFLLLVTLLAGCGAQPAVIETVPAGTPYEIPVDTSYDPLDFDHIVKDSSGGYFCVLRRPDDLAALRATFNPKSG